MRRAADLVDALAARLVMSYGLPSANRVDRPVLLSICNIDKPECDGFPYYLAKRAQEQISTDADLSTAIVRSSQCHEFATDPVAVSFGVDHVEVQDWLIQPIAAETVAEIILESAFTRPAMRLLAGPETIRLSDLTELVLRSQGDERPVQTLPAAFPALSEGALLAPGEAEVRGPDVTSWLELHFRARLTAD